MANSVRIFVKNIVFVLFYIPGYRCNQVGLTCIKNIAFYAKKHVFYLSDN